MTTVPESSPVDKSAEPTPVMVEPFFNRPGQPLPIQRLRAEILAARYCLAIASAWLTDESIIDAAIQSQAATKFFILSRSDVDRVSDPKVRSGYLRLADHAFGQSVDFWQEQGRPHRPPGVEPYRDFEAAIVGGETWRDGAMHHKFVLVDYDVVWTGSYNLTYQARANYEALVRIRDERTSIAFWTEVGEMIEDPSSRSGYEFIDFSAGAVHHE